MPEWFRRLRLERFARFGSVGALGTVVNLLLLWLGQEWLFARIEPESLRLTLALSLSIAISTVHNFAWNRAWTWADRKTTSRTAPPWWQQLGQYALACWFGILLQFILTRELADAMHYLLAASFAIALASVANYAINDLWTFGQRLLAAPSARLMLLMQAMLVGLTLWAYAHGLDGRNIPKNGDELVYAHITRLTAQTGHWLPLASELDAMRNTKPPLVFWQGLASTGFGEQWELWRLRWPSLAWTFATAIALGLAAAAVGRRVGHASLRAPTIPASRFPASGLMAAPGRPKPAAPTVFDMPTGLVAGLVFLGFFTTFRYGRPYLTNPPEVFWLSVPLLAMLAAWPRSAESRWAWPLGMAVAIGIGLLAKSFALLAPVGAVLVLWYLDHRRWRVGTLLMRDTFKLVIVAAVSLAVFALWFWLDPDPRAIWQEFVIGENVGKMGDRGHPWVTFFAGPDSGYEYAAAAFTNSGLLIGTVIALLLLAWRERGQWTADERRLWIWVGVFFVVFAIPSQRSARYLMPAMPALAMLLALRWRELPAWSARVGHVLALLVLAVFAWLSLGLQESPGAIADDGQPLVPVVTWAVYLLSATLALVGLSVTALNRTALLAVAAMVHLSIGLFLSPFEGRRGEYGPSVQQAVADRPVWVPCNFRARFEGHAFLLPASQPRGYDEREPASLEQLAARYPHFAVRLPLSAASPQCEGCRVLGERLDLRTRHRSDELRAMLTGDVVNQLFVREWLLEATPRASHAAHAGDAACR